MPTIAISTSKGGAGKTTLALILATEAAHMGIPVTLLDCDPTTGTTTALSVWAEHGIELPNLTCRLRISEGEVVNAIKAGEGEGKLVIVDLGGSASRLTTRAISQADLVIIPMNASVVDVQIGKDTIAMIREEEDTFSRRIPFALAITKTKGIGSGIMREMLSAFREQGVTVLEPSILDRDSYREFFASGGDLRTMKTRGNHGKAIENAQAFTTSVLNLLQEELSK